MNYKMTVQYDGTRYSGWQRQGNTASTVQGKLERILSSLLSEPIEISGSGRTDAGVHAVGQVANFKTDTPLSCGDFLDRFNEALPRDIAVTQLGVCSPRFHARLSAKEKTYRYAIWNSMASNVFERRYLYQLPEKLDLAAMEAVGKQLLGTHDFRGFSTGHTKKSTVRALQRVELQTAGDRVEIFFTANGFLYNMARIMAGTMIEAGLHQRTPESVGEVFETCDRKKAGFTAPPQGLCLMEVLY